MLPVAKPAEGSGDARLAYQGKERLLGGHEATASEADDSVLLIRNRQSRIYFGGQFLDYPLKPGMDLVRKMGPARCLQFAGSYTAVETEPHAFLFWAPKKLVVLPLQGFQPPFTGASTQAILAKMMTERPVPLHTMRDTVPPSVERAVLKALAKLPADRFDTAPKFAEALANPRSAGDTLNTRANHGEQALQPAPMALWWKCTRTRRKPFPMPTFPPLPQRGKCMAVEKENGTPKSWKAWNQVAHILCAFETRPASSKKPACP